MLELLQQQIETLENLTFATATSEELRRYHERRERIHYLGKNWTGWASEGLLPKTKSVEHVTGWGPAGL